MQESEGKPVTPGQWMEQNTEVLVPGLMIFLAMLVTTEGAGAMVGPDIVVLIAQTYLQTVWQQTGQLAITASYNN